MNKYEYAVREEIKWLNEDILQTQETLNTKIMDTPSRIELNLRLTYAKNELSRINVFMSEHEEREIEELKRFLIEHEVMSEERLNEFVEFFKKSKGD